MTMKIKVEDNGKVATYDIDEIVSKPGLYICKKFENCYFYITDEDTDLYIDVDQHVIEVLDPESWEGEEFVKVNRKITITLGDE
jgi:hypothetical protein